MLVDGDCLHVFLVQCGDGGGVYCAGAGDDYFESMEVLRWIMGVACELYLGDGTDRYVISGGGE